MNLMTAKTLDQVALAGVAIDWTKHDGAVKTITITDATGRAVTIKVANSYSETLSVLVPEPPKKEKRHVLHGTVAGIPIKKAFESHYDADCARDEFPSSASLEITETEVIVDEAGTADIDEMPF